MARPNKPWYRKNQQAWVTKIDGVQHTLARGPEAATRAEARKEFHRLMAERAKHHPNPGDSIRTDSLCDAFLDAHHATWKPLTFAWYVRHLKSFVASHGVLAASGVKPHHVLDWSNDHDWGPTTRRGAITAVKSVFSWARKVGHLDSDPLRDLERPTALRRQAILSPEAAALAIREANPLFSLFLEFLHETGARPGEAAVITAHDVDLTHRVVSLEVHKTAAHTQKPRTIVLSHRAMEILESLAIQRPDSEGPLFRNNRGNPWTGIAMNGAFRRLRQKTGLGQEATAQAFRHRFATDMAKIHPNSVVAAMLGHKTTSMVDRVYSHLGDEIETLCKAIDKGRPGNTKDTDSQESETS